MNKCLIGQKIFLVYDGKKSEYFLCVHGQKVFR